MIGEILLALMAGGLALTITAGIVIIIYDEIWWRKK
tara:strand:- start:191 stop:298 length:108 start_codon:yes stop_codon:yes gene_type:complete